MSYNINSDECQFLKTDNKNEQLISYGFYGFWGSPGSGKSYQMNSVAKQYIEQSKLSKYDLNNPYLNNGEITHNIYISPSVQTDYTLKTFKDKKLKIQPDDTKLQLLFKFFQEMNDDIGKMLSKQQYLRKTSLQTLLQDKTKTLNYIKAIEELKSKYPELKFQETSKLVYNQTKQLYQQFNMTFDGIWIRRQKIILRFDDYQKTELNNLTHELFTKLLTTKRHLGLWFIGISLHTFNITTKIFKNHMNSIFLFQGIDFEEIQDLYYQLPKLQLETFQINNFIDIYKNLNTPIENQTQQLANYNFMLIIQQPITKLLKNWNIEII